MDQTFCVWELEQKQRENSNSETVVLPRGITTIGRGLNNSLRCPSTLASRNHCEIKLLDSGLIFIKDLKSLNGTFLDSAKILPERYISLSHGDNIGIGVETTDIENGTMCIFHLTRKVLDKFELESRRGDDNSLVPLNGLPCEDSSSSKCSVTGEKTDNDIQDGSSVIVLSPESSIFVDQTHLNINQDHGLTISSDGIGNDNNIDNGLNKDMASKQQSNVDIKTGPDKCCIINNDNNDLNSGLLRNPNSTIIITKQSNSDSPLALVEHKLNRTGINSKIIYHNQPQSTLCVDTQKYENESSSKTKQGAHCSKAKLIEPDTGVNPDYEMGNVKNVIGEVDKLDKSKLSSTNSLKSTTMTTYTFLAPLHQQDQTANDKRMVTKNSLNYNSPVEKSLQIDSPNVMKTDTTLTSINLSNECFSAGKKESRNNSCTLENLKTNKSGTVSNGHTNTNDLVGSIQQQPLCSGTNGNALDIDNAVKGIVKRRLSQNSNTIKNAHDTSNHKNPSDTKNMTSSILERCNVDNSISLIDLDEQFLHSEKFYKKPKSESLDDQNILKLTEKVESPVLESFTIDDDIIIIDDNDLLPCSQMFDIKNEAVENPLKYSDIPVVDIIDEDDFSDADSSDEWFLRLSQCDPLNIKTLEDDYDLDSENNYVDSSKREIKESNIIDWTFKIEENTASEESINQIPLELNMDVISSEEIEPENKIVENNHAVKEKLKTDDSWLKQTLVDSNLNNTPSDGPNSNNKRKHESSESKSVNLTTVNHLDNQHILSKKMKQTHSDDVLLPVNNIAGGLNKITIKHDEVEDKSYSDSKPTTEPQKPAWKYLIDELVLFSNNWDERNGGTKTPCDEGEQKRISTNTSIQLKDKHDFQGQEHFESTASTQSLFASNDLNTPLNRETVQMCNKTPEESKLTTKTMNDCSSYKIKKPSNCSSKLHSIQEIKLESIKKNISAKHSKNPTPLVGAKALPGKKKQLLSADPILNQKTDISHKVKASKSKPWLSKGVKYISKEFSLTADKKAHRKSKLSEIANKTNLHKTNNTTTKMVKPSKNSIKNTHKNRADMFLDHLVSTDNSSKGEKSTDLNVESKQKNGLSQYKIPRINVLKDDKIESETLNNEDGSKRFDQIMSITNESDVIQTVKSSEIKHCNEPNSNFVLSKAKESIACDMNRMYETNMPACTNTETTSTGFARKQNGPPHLGLEYQVNDKSQHITLVIGRLKPIIKVPNSTLNNTIKKTVRFHNSDENKLIVNTQYIEIAEGSSLKPITKHIAKKETPPRRQDLKNALQIPCSNYFEETLHQICKWNTLWFQEKNTVKGEPPVFMGQIYHMKDSFISYSDYRRSIFPLMMHELWAALARHHDQIQNINKPFVIDIQRISIKLVTNVFFPIQKNGDKKTLCRLECQILLSKSNKPLWPRTGDLVVLDVRMKSPKDESFTRRILGYIFYCNFRAISSHSAISPKLKAQNVKATLVMDLSIYIKEERYKIDTTQESRIAVLKTIRPEMRLFNALDCLSTSSMLNIICQPCINNLEVPLRLNMEKSIHQTIDHLDKFQTKAVTNVANSCLTNTDMIHFIHGPPGCGKSEVIIGIIQMIFLAHIQKELTEPPQILLCAPSNAAIDDIFLRLMEYRDKFKKYFKNQNIKMLRIGRTDFTHKNVRSMTLDFLVEKDLKKRRDILEDEQSRQIELKTLEAKKNQLSYQLENLGSKKNDATYIRNVEIRLAETIKNMKELEKGKAQKALEGKELREKKSERELLFLEGANIIASTLSSCYNPQMEAAHTKKKLRFTCCIVDEATQCTEPELLIPLMLGVRQLVLVGDPLQLPATVLSSTAKEHGLDRSLFARHHNWWLQNNPDGLLKSRYHFLGTQYRMHPDIAKWPSQYFYNSSIKNHDSLEARGSSHPLMPYVILSHSFTQSNHEECNHEEVTLVELLVQAINASGLCKHRKIGVITPYSRQRELLRRKLLADIEVGTVDSFQGRERDIIILSCVRTEGVGFMSGTERLNVALTRARHSLIICGNFKSLQADSTWASLLQDAKIRGFFKTVPTSYRSQDLFYAISKSK